MCCSLSRERPSAAMASLSGFTKGYSITSTSTQFLHRRARNIGNCVPVEIAPVRNAVTYRFTFAVKTLKVCCHIVEAKAKCMLKPRPNQAKNMNLDGRQRRCVADWMAVVEEERERAESRKAGRTGLFVARSCNFSRVALFG